MWSYRKKWKEVWKERRGEVEKDEGRDRGGREKRVKHWYEGKGKEEKKEEAGRHEVGTDLWMGRGGRKRGI